MKEMKQFNYGTLWNCTSSNSQIRLGSILNNIIKNSLDMQMVGLYRNVCIKNDYIYMSISLTHSKILKEP